MTEPAATAMASHEQSLRASVTALWGFLRPGNAPMELQALDVPSGGKWRPTNEHAYASSVEQAIKLALEMERRKPIGTYVIMNTLADGVDSRHEHGVWVQMKERQSTSDRDIAERCAILIDIDPPRVGYISSTDAQHDHALSGRGDAERVLVAAGVPPTAIAHCDSGNGHALLIAVDMPATETRDLVRDMLHALDVQLSCETVKIDCSTCDAKRLCAMFGTVKRKGAAGRTDRPHRQSSITCPAPEEVTRLDRPELERVIAAMIGALTDDQRSKFDIDTGRTKKAITSAAKTQGNGAANEDDIWAFARDRCPIVEVLGYCGKLDGNSPICPGCGTIGSTGDTSVAVVGNGLKCLHDRCSAKGISGKPGFRSTIDVVMESKGVDAKGALKLMAGWFGFELTPPKAKPKAKSEATASTTQKGPTGRGRMCTDSGNAERLVDQHGTNIRHVADLGWFIWDGRRWEEDETGEVHRRAKATVRNIYREAAASDNGAELGKWGAKSESRSARSAMVALAAVEESVVARAAELDADAWLFNVANGTIDLRTGQIGPHRREDLITKLSPVEYDSGADCPTWEAFLLRVMPDPEVRTFLQRFAGYSLTASAREHALSFLFGSGGNGKGVFLNTLRALFGDYATKAPRGLLMTQIHEKHSTELMPLRGARFVWCSEVNENDSWDESKTKDLVSEDPITARLMHQDNITFMPTHKLWIAGNHKPKVRGSDDGIWRRLRLVPFGVTITADEKDLDLVAKLAAEQPGILAWAVRGCLEWQAHGLGEPAAVQAATKEYRASEDQVGRFLVDRCLVEATEQVRASDVYNAFRDWAEQEGEGKPMSQKKFGTRLAQDFTPSRETTKDSRARTWKGLRLLRSGEAPADTGDDPRNVDHLRFSDVSPDLKSLVIDSRDLTDHSGSRGSPSPALLPQAHPSLQEWARIRANSPKDVQ